MGVADEELMLRVGRGDRDACRLLVERHLGRVVAFAARVLGSPSEAEDVAQEAFARVWTSAGSWRPDARFTTWLHRVTLNLCLDRLGRRREAPLEDAPEPADPAPPPATGWRKPR
jgi:RNA polymerase sigma-70 factor, ECF subfamily